MKICFVCNEYPPASHYGLGEVYQSLAESLVQRGVEVWVIGYGKRRPSYFVQNGVKIVWLTLPSFFHRSFQRKGSSYSLATFVKRPYLSLRLNFLARKIKFDLVESSDFNGPIFNKPPSKLIVRLEGAVTAYRYAEKRSNFMHPVDKHFERKQLLLADYIIACSNHIGELTNEAFNLDLPFKLIYNAVDTKLFKPMPGKSKPGTILYVGNIMWRKGIFDLIRAMPNIIKAIPYARLLIAGGAGGSHKVQLDSELSSLPIEIRERIDILDYQEHNSLPTLYNNAAIVVFPSHVEAFGLTCVEAMACARPVVATSLASGPELVEDGISGLLVNPEDSNDIAEKVITLLNDPLLSMRLGNNARKRVLQMFDLSEWGQRNLDYYRSLI